MGERAEVDVLLRHYEEHSRQRRHHEDMRAQATSIMVAIAGGVIALAGLDGLSTADIPSGVLVITLALLGVLLSLKHYERFRWHSAISDELRAEIDRALVDPSGSPRPPTEVSRDASTKHFSDWTATGEIRRGRHRHDELRPASPIARIRLFVLWAVVPSLVGLVGVLLVVLSIAGIDS